MDLVSVLYMPTDRHENVLHSHLHSRAVTLVFFFFRGSGTARAISQLLFIPGLVRAETTRELKIYFKRENPFSFLNWSREVSFGSVGICISILFPYCELLCFTASSEGNIQQSSVPST